MCKFFIVLHTPDLENDYFTMKRGLGVNNPKITVLMSVYNTDKKWLIESIDSILSQTFTDFEFVIVLDCPTDGCESVVYDYAKKDSRIVVIENETNVGLTKSLNIGLSQSRGNYIARMDADDIALKERLNIQYNFMKENKDVVVVGSYVATFGAGKTKCGGCYISENVERERIRLLFNNTGVAHPTAFIRKSFLDCNNIKYNEEFEKAQDYALWIDIVNANGKIALIDKVLLLYRESKNQISVKCSEKQLDCKKKAIKKQLDLLLSTTEKEFELHCELYCIKCTFELNDYQNFMRKLIEANNDKGVYDKRMFKEEVYAIWIKDVLLAVTKFKSFYFLTSKMFWRAVIDVKPFLLVAHTLKKSMLYEKQVEEYIKSLKPQYMSAMREN